MNPEIEKFIDLAIADGQITEKERNVILKKAVELGVDIDEVEMVLDGKLHQLEANKPKQKEKVGIISSCPACGASTTPFSDVCAECGHTYRYDSLNKLQSKLQDGSSDLVTQISMHSIPINREALIDFLSFSYGNANNKGLQFEIRSAWNSKFNEALEKAKFTFSNPEDKNLLKDFSFKQARLALDLRYSPEEEKQLKEDSKKIMKNPILYISLFFCYVIYAFIFSLFGKHIWPF
jgi:hypothetical protein